MSKRKTAVTDRMPSMTAPIVECLSSKQQRAYEAMMREPGLAHEMLEALRLLATTHAAILSLARTSTPVSSIGITSCMSECAAAAELAIAKAEGEL